MARAKKESVSVCIRMERNISELLSDYCKKTGVSKTVAIERSVTQLIDNFEREQRVLKDAKKHSNQS